jgi:hypothetical protein
MQKLNTLKKQSLYLVGALGALVASYVIASDDYSITLNEPSFSAPEVYADIPADGGGIPDGDCGDVGDGTCQ